MTTSATSSAARETPKPPSTVVNLKEPGQLLAATPQLLGFRPAESVVLIGHAAPRGNRIGLVLRGDLPPRNLWLTQAECLVTALAGTGDIGATIVLVGGLDGPGSDAGNPPNAGFVEIIAKCLKQVGMGVMHAMWVPEISTGGPWACYSDPDCGGVLPEVDSTVAAAVAAHAGVVTFDSREEMERLLAPADKVTIARRAALLNSEFDKSGPPDNSAESRERGLAAVRAALQQAGRDELVLTDEQAVELALALANPRVRDACLATAIPAGTKSAGVAERLWLALVRGLPAPERADAAGLLGYATYMRGEGALAGIAFENALAADPGHVLSTLLITALRHGMEPQRLSGVGQVEGVADLTGGTVGE